ncbi:MAG: hypothetical protein HY902_16015, partial [Deltaproteobacteria bacterium]|nr:hypothetical protein [Deltaproteobacteria bacterium]
NDTTAIVSGDLSGDWVGKNIKGAWSITVKDLKAGGGSGGFDGTFNWSINIQTLSSKKVQVKGNLIVDGNTVHGGSIVPGNDTATCSSANDGALRYTSAKGLEACTAGNWVAALPKLITYTGYCNHHGTGGGWNAYCLTDTVMNTAADYFSVTDAGNGVITVKVPGYYRMYGNWLYNNCWNSDGLQILKNGGRIGSGYSSAANGVWGMHVVDVTYPLAKGDTIQVQAYNSGCNGYAYHVGSSAGTWSKFNMQYVGAP